MVKTIEEMVANGSVFKPQQTFRIGWMLTRVESLDAKRLTLYGPDMKTIPIKWFPGITKTLRQKLVQVFMLDSFSLRQEMSIPSILQSMVVCKRFQEPNFFMNESHGTGWRAGFGMVRWLPR